MRICGEIEVKYLTLYTFSNENWLRPSKEVSAIMSLLMKTISKEITNLHKNNVRFNAIGDLDSLPKESFDRIHDGILMTKKNTGLNLILAFQLPGYVVSCICIINMERQGTLKHDKNENLTENRNIPLNLPLLPFLNKNCR